MRGRFAPGIRRADGPGQVTGDVRRSYTHPVNEGSGTRNERTRHYSLGLGRPLWAVLASLRRRQHRQHHQRGSEAWLHFTHSSFWRCLGRHCNACLPDSRLVGLVLGSRASRHRDIASTCRHDLRHAHQNQMTATPNKTDAGNGSKAICRVSNVHPSPSPDPRRSVRI